MAHRCRRRSFSSCSNRPRAKSSAVPSNGAGPSSRGPCRRFRHLRGPGYCRGYRTGRFLPFHPPTTTTSGDHFRFRCCCCCACRRTTTTSCCHGTGCRTSFRRGGGNFRHRRQHYSHGGQLPETSGPYGGVCGPASDGPGYPYCTNRFACGILRRGAYPADHPSTGCYRTAKSDYRCTSRALRCTDSGSCPGHCSCCFRPHFRDDTRLHHRGTSCPRGSFLPGCGSTLPCHDSSGRRNGNSEKPSRKHDVHFLKYHFQ